MNSSTSLASSGLFSERALCRWIFLVGLLLFVWGRLGLPPEEFSNADIAGMTYNADLLNDGMLPYIESIEGKAPGTFFLTALVFRVFGRGLTPLWWFFLTWQLLGALAVWVGARALYHPSKTLSAAVATGLFLASAGQFDLVYTSWMTTPYAWAFTAAIVGLKSGRVRWHLLAGLCAMFAFLMKRQAVVLVPLFPILFVWAKRLSMPGAKGSTWGWWSLGASALPLPLLIFYLDKGHLLKLITSIFPVESVMRYATWESPISTFEIIGLVLAQCYETFPLAASLGIASLVVATSDRSSGKAENSWPVFPQVAFLILSVMAGSLGGPRYYQHYLLQYLPALALLAARPGLFTFFRAWTTATVVQRTVRYLLLLLLLIAVGWHIEEYARGEEDRRPEEDLSAAREAGLFIAERTTEDETIMVWGWTAWPTYFWADRRAPVLGYKSLGLLTSPNTNSSFFKSQPIRFQPGVHADALMRAFRDDPPAYFVFSSYYRSHLRLKEEPLFEWREFVDMIKRDYELEASFGELVVHGRRDRKRH